MNTELASSRRTIEIFELFFFTQRFLSEVDNIADTYTSFVPLTIEEEKKRLHSTLTEIARIRDHIEHPEDNTDVLVSESTLSRILDDLMKTTNSPKSQIIVKSVFIYLFTSLENLMSDLLYYLYLQKQELLGSIDRSVSLNQLMAYSSVEEAVNAMVLKELETFRRHSFIKQFTILEQKFGIKLTKFKNWPAFVECTQRRNLVTHCNGIISQQYLETCRAEGYTVPDDQLVGTPLRLDRAYFMQAIDIVREVGIKFSQTIWRKFFPERLNEADRFLIDYTYKLLSQQQWELARVMGEYSIRLPDKYDDVSHRMMHINLAIALYHQQGRDAAQKILETLDWSSCIDDFRLAVAVLSERFDDAAALMRGIGKEGKFVTKETYLEWPLFQRYRNTRQFLDAYRDVYGTDFITEITHNVEKLELAEDTGFANIMRTA